MVFAAVLCTDISSEHTRVGHRIGKLGLSLLQQYYTSMTLLPTVPLTYYGHVGILFEPLQVRFFDVLGEIMNTSTFLLTKLI